MARRVLVTLLLLVLCVVAGVFFAMHERGLQKSVATIQSPPKPMAAAEKSKSTTRPKTQYVLNPKDLEGFEKCANGPLTEAIGKLIATGRNVRKEDNAWWIEGLSADFVGLPVVAVGTGVCNREGEVACGWAMYKAIVISKPLDEVQSHLIDKFGDNFTVQERDPDTNITLRPILAPGESTNESYLFCDSGWL